MAPTTLITFMVRTPPTSRSVSLYGSWDNFSKSYSMHRDSRIGPEHWSGCHKFSNIVYDGNKQPDGQAREGGLRMGGTYWYYYRLDDDIDFYNSAEPTTTQCPLLPGQLVNVLQMPYALSGSRSRNASVSSTSSEKRTMEPGDKYMNPRPVPRPKLHRLQTSPTVGPEPWSSSAPTSSASASRSGWSAGSGKSSAPSSAATLKIPLLSRKTSLDSHSRYQSPNSAITNGLKSAFRSFRSPRSTSPEEEGRTIENALEAAEKTPLGPKDARPHTRSLASSRDPSPTTRRGRHEKAEHDLAFRRQATGSSNASVESLSLSSFAEHRRQRSRSRETSSLRNSLALEDTAAVPVNDLADRRKQLSTVKEVASTQNTPGLPLNGPKSADIESAIAAMNLEKRLPTLPNTPSSAYPPSVTDIKSTTPDIDQLQSHFSCTTIDTSSSAPSSATNSARFSNFSSVYASTTGSSIHTYSEIDDESMAADTNWAPRTPKTGQTIGTNTDIDDTPQATSTFPPRDMSLPSAISSSAISSTSASSLSTSPSEFPTSGYTASEYTTDSGDQSSRPRFTQRFQYQHYRLPADEVGSEVTLNPTRSLTSREGNLPEMHHGFKIPFQQFVRDKPSKQDMQQLETEGPGFPHSNSMQQLLNELSYLGDMIHQR